LHSLISQACLLLASHGICVNAPFWPLGVSGLQISGSTSTVQPQPAGTTVGSPALRSHGISDNQNARSHAMHCALCLCQCFSCRAPPESLTESAFLSQVQTPRGRQGGTNTPMLDGGAETEGGSCAFPGRPVAGSVRATSMLPQHFETWLPIILLYKGWTSQSQAPSCFLV
jgi:hypothetical protein